MSIGILRLLSLQERIQFYKYLATYLSILLSIDRLFLVFSIMSSAIMNIFTLVS